jgi:outer membrane lipopolysaccharide assembly protein LptE/RlpB
MRVFLACAAAGLLASCGYHISGRADLVPKSIQTVSIPPFGNLTTHYQLTDRLPQALSREFIARTRYKIVTDPDRADAVLRGTVTRYMSFPTILDPQTSRAAAVQISVTLQVSLTNRRTGEVIWQQPSFDVRQQYEIASQQEKDAYFDESGVALDRLCRETAQSVVSAILENF